MNSLVVNNSSVIARNPILSSPKKQEPPSPEPSLCQPKLVASASVSFNQKPPTEADLNYLCKNGRLRDAVAALDSLAPSKPKLKPKTFVNLLQSCIESNSLSLGRRVHARLDLVEERTLPLETKLLGMYAKCGALEDARQVFGGMRQRNLYTWSAMIGALCRDRRWNEVVEMFVLMVEDGVLPDALLFPKILQACGNTGDLGTGALMHSLAVRCGFGGCLWVDNTVLAVYAKCGEMGLAKKLFEGMGESDIVAWNGMISGYCRLGDVEQARSLFEAMWVQGCEPNLRTWNTLIDGYSQMGAYDAAVELMKRMESLGVQPDVVTWTSLISGLAYNNKMSQALDLFKQMVLSDVRPNFVTLATTLSACASYEALRMGLEVHCLGVKLGLTDEMPVANALIDLYSKCSNPEAARKVFDSMPQKDIYSWNTMIGGYLRAGYCGRATVLFIEMLKSRVQPDVMTWNIMISGYMENGEEDLAFDVFERMAEDGTVGWDRATWNSLIAGYFHIGKKSMALAVLRKMQSSGFSPNCVTILSVLPACANLIAFNKVKEVHGFILRSGLDSMLSIINPLINTYGKAGNLVYARTLFDSVPSKDFVTFDAMIAGYVLHGCSKAAVDLVDQMMKLGLKPSGATLTDFILACSHLGMVDEGRQVFSRMNEVFQIMPASEHYSAMVHLYGRSGLLQDAVELIEGMPIKPESSVWYALMTACKVRGNIDSAIRAGERILQLEPNNYSVRQFLLNAYTICRRRTDTATLLGKEKRVPLLIGQSWIEVKNTVHSFSGDQYQSCSDLLLSWVRQISREVKGHIVPRFCAEEEENEEIAGVHSEKLAMAFAFVSSTSGPRTIRIMKYYRICGDCHGTAKYVSKKHDCEIYISDASSFHHFKSGHCSCGDYW